MNSFKIERIKYLDVARTFAIISVILVHSIQSVFGVTLNMEYVKDVSAVNLFVYTLLFTIGKLGVPIFLCISGTLLLNKNFKKSENIAVFYKKNLLKLFIVVSIWILIYSLTNHDISLIKKVFFMESTSYSHMWYMPMILAVYVFIPYISVIVKKYSIKYTMFPLAFMLLIYVCIPSINVMLNIFHIKNIYSLLQVGIIGNEYIIYLVFGYYISKGSFKNNSNESVIVLFIIFLILTIVFQMYAYINEYAYDLWYNFIFLFISALLLYEIFFRLRKSICNANLKIFKNISKYSLGMFFIHMPIIKILKKYININVNDLLKSLIIFLIGLLISYLIVSVFSKVKVIKKYLFLVKE